VGVPLASTAPPAGARAARIRDEHVGRDVVSTTRPRLVGINHVALEVGDLDAALAFYGAIFDLREVDREPGIAFIDIGDQFIALAEGRTQPPDQARHFGLVVDDKPATRTALEAREVEIRPGPRLDFLDPSGNQVQIVDYRDVQYTKAPRVIRAMGLEHLRKRDSAIEELRTKGLA
jgi:catechol 2,3-dioxygenase-like lactoylglutathione lyase family enzyme